VNDLDSLILELEGIAQRLRAEELRPEEAAQLVDRCAELAARIGSGLDAEARDTEGQERLL
jgi:hypothetical protein